MEMVGHEAVGNKCKLFVICSTQNLLHRDTDVCLIREQRIAIVSAERQEISMKTGVVERSDMTRIACAHGTYTGKK
jgi:hypothetical protein